MQEKHPADKFKRQERENSPEDEIKKLEGKTKKTSIKYYHIRNNTIFAKKVKLLTDVKGGLLMADGTPIQSLEQEVFEILMIGDITDDHGSFMEGELNAGDQVLVTQGEFFLHNDNCDACSDTGERMLGYYVIDTRHVIAKVNYIKI